MSKFFALFTKIRLLRWHGRASPLPTRGGSSRNCDCRTRAWSELGVVIIGYGQVKLSYGGLKRGTRESGLDCIIGLG